MKQRLSSQEASQMKEILRKAGVPEEIAELYSKATEGGKTGILQNIMDLDKRGLLNKSLFNPSNQSEKQDEDSQFPELPAEKGLTPAEVIKREDKRESTNIPFYNTANEKLRGYERESMALDRLQKLPNLPTGLNKFNVNPKTGELFFPALSSPEAQLFAKTINDFTTKAKDSYGARVTNFELDRFMKRLPTLANSPEGRQLIISQMKLINDLDRLEDKSLVDVYDHYGVGRINSQQAKQLAKIYRKEQEDIIKDRFKDLDGKINSLMKRRQGNSVTLYDPSGREISVPEGEVEEALKLGARRK